MDIYEEEELENESKYSGRQNNQRVGNIRDYKSNMDKEYGDLVRNKRNEENTYRKQFEIEDGKFKSQKKIVEFDESDEALFKFVLRERARRNRDQLQSARGSREQAKISQAENLSSSDSRSFSVPPSRKVPHIFGGPSSDDLKMKNREHKLALEDQIREKQRKKETFESGTQPHTKQPYIFGGSSHAMIRKQKNLEHKKFLEEQIKGKEHVKERERLKRMGRITSDIIDPWISNSQGKTETKNNNNSEGTSNQKRNIDVGRVLTTTTVPDNNHNMSNNMVPFSNANQFNYPMNPAFNPMINYLPGGFPHYGMTPAGYMNNMQIPTNLDQMNQVNSGAMYNNQLIQNRTENNKIEEYVPSAVAESQKTRTRKPGMVANIAVGDTAPRETSSAKKAQMLNYQGELKQQMNIKKEAAERDRLERLKFEIKKEKEIAEYDPWGRAGCGAPMRSDSGKVVTDLKMFLQNKEKFGFGDGVKSSNVNGEEDVKGSEDVEAMLAAMGRGDWVKELRGLPKKTDHEKSAEISYKDFLQQQVDEKKRKADELREKERIEEEKENKRLVEQQRKMREEFEREKELQQRKQEDTRTKNEAMQAIAQQKRQEAQQQREKDKEDVDAERRQEGEERLAAITITSKKSTKDLEVQTSYQQTRNQSEPKHDKDREEFIDHLRTTLNVANLQLENGYPWSNVENQKLLIMHIAALRKQLALQENMVRHNLKRDKEKYKTLIRRERLNPYTIPYNSIDPYGISYNDGDPFGMPYSGTDPYDISYDSEDMFLASTTAHARRNFDTQQRDYLRQQEQRLKEIRKECKGTISTIGGGGIPVPWGANVSQGVTDNGGGELVQHVNKHMGSNHSLLQSESQFFPIDNHEEIQKDDTSKVDARNSHKESGNKIEVFSDLSHWQKNTEQPVEENQETGSISTLQLENIRQKNEERLDNIKMTALAENENGISKGE